MEYDGPGVTSVSHVGADDDGFGQLQFADVPTESERESQFSGQTRLTVAALEAAAEFAEVWVGLHRK